MDCLVQLEEILTKYRDSHEILIGGDLNVDLTKNIPSKKKCLLLQFIENFNLNVSYDCQTYINPLGIDCSEIDYFPQSEMKDRQITEKNCYKHLETNSSDHYPVSISVLSSYTEIKDKLKTDQHTSLCKTRIKWDKVDKERYSQLVTTYLEQLQFDNKDSQFGLESITETICDILVTSAKSATPQKKQNKNKPKLKVWNADISSALKDSRTARKNWLQAGKPNDPNHPTCMKKKLCKKKFRSCCRIEIAQKFIKNKEDIMQAKRYDNKLFYKLINKQRGSSSSVITDLTAGEQCFSGEENVIDGFKLHFQNLATKQNDNEYDNFYNQVEYVYDIIGELTSLKNIQPVTKCEMQKAIDSLNKGKAPDIYGLTVENILFGGSTIKTFMLEVINDIFSKGVVPDNLKFGLLSPVFKKKGKKSDSKNYRGITVLPVIGKIIEAIFRSRMRVRTEPTHCPLQRGFTAKLSPLNTALIVEET